LPRWLTRKNIITTKIRLRNIKTLIIVDDYIPDSKKAGATMMHDLAKEYVLNGHEVNVITPSNNIIQKFQILDIDGVRVYQFKSGKIKNINKVVRLFNEMLLPYRAWKHLKFFFRKNKHDNIIYYSPTIFFGLLVNRLKKLWNATSFLVLRDSFPQWLVDSRIIKQNSPTHKFFQYFENINYRNADHIGLMSQANLEFFNKNFPYYKNRSIILHNWITKTRKLPLKNSFRTKFDLQNKVIFFYGGNIGLAQDVLSIAKLAKEISKLPKAFFVIVGDGDEFLNVKKFIKKNKLKNIILLPSVSKEEFNDMLQESDIGLFTINNLHKSHNFPGKILEYLNYNKPMLGTLNEKNDLKKIIEYYEVGLVSYAGDSKVFYDHARRMLNDSTRNKFSTNLQYALDEVFSTKIAYKTIQKYSNKEIFANNTFQSKLS